MFPSLQLGSVSLPTGPLTALLAVWLAIEIAARMGRRHGLQYDDLFGLFMLALTVGILGARLGHVFAFWDVYRAHPGDILSLRPAGLSVLPGVICACVTAYVFLIVRRMDPVIAMAATLTGLVAGGTIYFIGSFLSGRVIGTPSPMPWAVPYGDLFRHPVGLYQALGCALIWLILWYRTLDVSQILLTGLFLCGLLFLFTDAFVIYRWTSPILRWPQVGYLGIAVLSALLLARRSSRLANSASPSSTGVSLPDTPSPEGP